MLIPKFIKIGLAVLPRKGNRQAELFSKTVSNSYDIIRGVKGGIDQIKDFNTTLRELNG